MQITLRVSHHDGRCRIKGVAGDEIKEETRFGFSTVAGDLEPRDLSWMTGLRVVRTVGIVVDECFVLDQELVQSGLNLCMPRLGHESFREARLICGNQNREAS